MIADPFLKDPNFARSVVLLCDHGISGSIGFVLNKPYGQQISHLLTSLEFCDFPVYDGGPVQKDTVYFLHHCPNIITGGIEVAPGLFWGGDFAQAVEGIRTGAIRKSMLRFFIGYSGWTAGQLADELSAKSWILSPGDIPTVFFTHTKDTWRQSLVKLGGEYEFMPNYPLDPQLN